MYPSTSKVRDQILRIKSVQFDSFDYFAYNIKNHLKSKFLLKDAQVDICTHIKYYAEFCCSVMFRV